MTSRRDDARAVVGPLLNDLQSELLVMPREDVVHDHLAMMAFEQQILATPRLARRTRSSLVRPRRTAFVVACVCTTVVSCGLSAAGALPEPLQNITDSIARTLGVPEPHVAPAPEKGAAGSAVKPTTPPAAHRPAVGPAPNTSSTIATPTDKKAAAVQPPAVKPTPDHVVNPPEAPFTPIRPTVPSKRITPKPPRVHPSKNSDNTPPGYPTTWRGRAVAAATAQLQACSQAQALVSDGCPQVATAVGENTQAQSVHWTLLNDPEAGAVAVAQTKFGNAAKHTAPTTTVTVYEQFQMDAAYTVVGDDSRTYLAYSGGIAQATMTWNGKAFENVTFSSGSAAGHLLPGVTVASIVRPDAATDASVLAAVQAGFNDCSAIKAPAAHPIASCAPDAVAGTQWTVGDPTQGAAVVFDHRQGTFTVTGTFSITGTDAAGTSVTTTGHYTATLFFDGEQVQLLAVAAGP